VLEVSPRTPRNYPAPSYDMRAAAGITSVSVGAMG
jgi:hypothetical protein